jgi:hypothetical protein
MEKYSIAFYTKEMELKRVKTNSWFTLMKLKLTTRWVYYQVHR